MNNLITNHLHRHLEASPEAATAALRHPDPLQPLSDALTALGLGQRASLRRTAVPVAVAAEPVSLTLTWQLAEASQAHITWTLSVAATGNGDSLISASISAGTNPATTDRQLLAAWPLLQPIIDSFTNRFLNTVTDLAEQIDEENSLDRAPAPLLLAAA